MVKKKKLSMYVGPHDGQTTIIISPMSPKITEKREKREREREREKKD